jgi:hypothetical protein
MRETRILLGFSLRVLHRCRKRKHHSATHGYIIEAQARRMLDEFSTVEIFFPKIPGAARIAALAGTHFAESRTGDSRIEPQLMEFGERKVRGRRRDATDANGARCDLREAIFVNRACA